MTQTNTNRATRVSTVPRRSTSEIAAQPAESLKLDALIHERVRLAIVLRNLDVATAPDLDLLQRSADAVSMPYFRDFDDAMVAIRAARITDSICSR